MPASNDDVYGSPIALSAEVVLLLLVISILLSLARHIMTSVVQPVTAPVVNIFLDKMRQSGMFVSRVETAGAAHLAPVVRNRPTSHSPMPAAQSSIAMHVMTCCVCSEETGAVPVTQCIQCLEVLHARCRRSCVQCAVEGNVMQPWCVVCLRGHLQSHEICGTVTPPATPRMPFFPSPVVGSPHYEHFADNRVRNAMLSTASESDQLQGQETLLASLPAVEEDDAESSSSTGSGSVAEVPFFRRLFESLSPQSASSSKAPHELEGSGQQGREN